MSRLTFRRPADEPGSDDAVTRALRDAYRAPSDPAYWTGFESRLMAAVRDGAAKATQPAVEWWQALARWSRPGLAAAAALLVTTGAVVASSGRASGEPSAFRRMLGTPPATPLSPADPDLARFFDPAVDPRSPEARAARDAADLLGTGLERRGAVRLDSLPGGAAPDAVTEAAAEAARRAEREATLRLILPED
jgi:hypothetical protein